MGKAWEHSPCEWTQGRLRGEGANIQYVCTKLKYRFLTSQVVWMSGVPINSRVLRNGWSSTLCQVGAPQHPPCVHLMSFTWWMLKGSPTFHHSSASVYYCEHKLSQKGKTRALETRVGETWRQILTHNPAALIHRQYGNSLAPQSGCFNTPTVWQQPCPTIRLL